MPRVEAQAAFPFIALLLLGQAHSYVPSGTDPGLKIGFDANNQTCDSPPDVVSFHVHAVWDGADDGATSLALSKRLEVRMTLTTELVTVVVPAWYPTHSEPALYCTLVPGGEGDGRQLHTHHSALTIRHSPLATRHSPQFAAAMDEAGILYSDGDCPFSHPDGYAGGFDQICSFMFKDEGPFNAWTGTGLFGGGE